MCRLDCRDDSLHLRQILERVNRLVIRDRNVLRPSYIVKICVLRSYSRIVKPCRNRVNRGNLSIFVLAEI